MFKVSYGQDPYDAIGKYIRDHITAIEDIIAVIKIGDVETNQLFTVDINEENCFVWKNDWWEGDKDITLIDFFPVSEAINPSAQPKLYGYPVEHLAMIATVLQKENLPPERVAEMLSDVGRIVEMVRDEFEEKLRKALEGVNIEGGEAE